MAVPNFQIHYGLELECGINRERPAPSSHIIIGGYHSGISLNADWVAEDDGSINSLPENFRSVEFVTRIFTKDELVPLLEFLKKKIDPDTDSMENIRINTSCGAHIHFSAKSAKAERAYRHLHHKVPIQSLMRIRMFSHERIKLRYPKIYEKFQEKYSRDYAQVHDTMSMNYRGDRRTEFNCTTNKGMEWRSFNLHGVKKWSELIGMCQIAVGAIEEVIGSELKTKMPFMVEYAKIKESPIPVGAVVPMHLEMVQEIEAPDESVGLDTHRQIRIPSERTGRGRPGSERIMVVVNDGAAIPLNANAVPDRSPKANGVFSVGDKIIIIKGSNYSGSREGSIGTITKVYSKEERKTMKFEQEYDVLFSKLTGTGVSAPHTFDILGKWMAHYDGSG